MYDAVRDLRVPVESWSLSTRERDTSSGFRRVTTVVELRGDGAGGRGEDVTYDAADHEALAAADPDWDLAGERTFAEFSALLDGLELFPEEPGQAAARDYRRWAFESAALDLALRAADTDLGSVLGRSYDPVRFVVSTRLGDPPTPDRVHELLALSAGTELKLDPTPEWDADLVAELAATDAVRVLDLKGAYEGTVVDNPPDPDGYRLVVEGFPEAVIEDPALTDETRPVFDGEEDRVAWDAPIHGLEDVHALPFEPSWLNVKPSRFGTVESLFETVEYCEREGIRTYGGGQFELDVGRGQIQALASLFYPAAPNDVAPGVYNDPTVPEDAPTSPLNPPADPAGFGW